MSNLNSELIPIFLIFKLHYSLLKPTLNYNSLKCLDLLIILEKLNTIIDQNYQFLYNYLYALQD